MKIKLILTIPIIITIILLSGRTVMATELPYDSYNYDYWNDIVYTPAAYVPGTSITGTELGVGAFVNPQDLYVAVDGLVYVADTGNNRIVVLNSDMTTVIKTIDAFDNNGTSDTFKTPSGLCVTANNNLYIADTDNFRVVVLDGNGKLLKTISNPTSEVLDDGFVFYPLKVSVDYADRVYVIAKNMFQGVMAFDKEGNFTGFSGTINVQISATEKLWRKLSTKAQRAKQVLFIPTEFTGMDIDQDGFLYAANVDNQGLQAVRRLNPKGQDVVKKGDKKNVGGDIQFGRIGTYAGPSHITDVVVRDKGIFSMIDTKRGRIFTYDHEGNLLYIFGGLGTQEGTFKIPVAIETIGNKIIVLDSTSSQIITFNETEYGGLINDAIGLRYDGDEALAVDLWKKVLKFDSNFELANIGIGKAYLTAGDNKNAMKYLKLGMSKEYYSIAFKRFRNKILKENLGYIFTGVVLLLIIVKVICYRKNKTGRRTADD